MQTAELDGNVHESRWYSAVFSAVDGELMLNKVYPELWGPIGFMTDNLVYGVDSELFPEEEDTL